jgi:uncharacterized protein
MSTVNELLAGKFVCSKCGQSGAHVENLSMSGTGISRVLRIQLYEYAFISCVNCGFTEVYNLKLLKVRG